MRDIESYSNNRGAKSNIDDDEEFHNDDFSDQDKVSNVKSANVNVNKSRSDFKKAMASKSNNGNLNNNSDTDDTSESEVSLAQRSEKPFSLKEFYDFDKFPESTGAACLPWTDFTRDFLSLDMAMTP